MNKFLAVVRLTKDPQIRTTASGAKIADFSVAVNRTFKRDGQPDADFFNCAAFGKKAEFVEKYVRKGTKLVIEGQVQNNNYTNKEGQKVYGTLIVVDNMEFAESKKASTTAEATADAPVADIPAAATAQPGDEFVSMPADVDDLPFN